MHKLNNCICTVYITHPVCYAAKPLSRGDTLHCWFKPPDLNQTDLNYTLYRIYKKILSDTAKLYHITQYRVLLMSKWFKPGDLNQQTVLLNFAEWTQRIKTITKNRERS